MKIIKQRQRCTDVSYALEYHWKDDPNAGFSFNCDEQGNIDRSKESKAARENYDNCVNGTYDVCQPLYRPGHRPL